MSSAYGVIDLFAGPGGLGEGFAGYKTADRRPFQIVISAEKEAAAHSTLRLRAFVRAHLAKEGCLPDGYEGFHRGGAVAPFWEDHPLWFEAEHEARRLTLGSPEAREPIAEAIAEARSRFGENTVVIGGPPCQAYSLVGRARNRGVEGYKAEEDGRHFLFREYIAVLRALHPAVFVMENVTGMLSSSVSGRRVFEMVLEDLRSLGGEEGSLYDLVALSPRSLLRTAPQDFIVHAEDHGVPQRRHRVIIVGVRKDVAEAWRERRADGGQALLTERPRATVRQVIGGFPRLRSGLSRERDDFHSWSRIRELTAAFLAELPDVADVPDDTEAVLRRLPREAGAGAPLPRSSIAAVRERAEAPDDLIRFLTAMGFDHTAQHETRAHVRSDLARYMFASAVAGARGASPKARDFPDELAPDHANWTSGKFADRFRVQVWDEPSSTVTSHIAKDGHYFIHPDVAQCRSLTVREAARLQTFPDDYLFLGSRTQQFVQVGNAVPPYLARQIAEAVLGILE